MLELPQTLTEVLKIDEQIRDLSKIFTYAHNFIYLGRGYHYPTALEGALKLKEISYIHAEGYPAAEMKHGPIALIDHEMPVVAIATPDRTYAKTVSNIEEVKARGGRIIAVIARDDETGAPHRRLLHRGAGGHGVPDAHRGQRAPSAAGLLHRRVQGPQCRSAAQPRQVGDGGVTAAGVRRTTTARKVRDDACTVVPDLFVRGRI